MHAGWDFVLWGVLLAAVVLWSVLRDLVRRARERVRAAAARQGRAQAPQPLPETLASPPDDWGRRPGAEPPAVVVPVVVQPTAPPRGPTGRAVLAPGTARRWRTRAGLRRAIVDMAVLGPPRSLQDWDGAPDAAGPSRTPRR